MVVVNGISVHMHYQHLYTEVLIYFNSIIVDEFLILNINELYHVKQIHIITQLLLHQFIYFCINIQKIDFLFLYFQ